MRPTRRGSGRDRPHEVTPPSGPPTRPGERPDWRAGRRPGQRRLRGRHGCGCIGSLPGSSGSTWCPRRPPRWNSETSTPGRGVRARAAAASGFGDRPRHRCRGRAARRRRRGCSSFRRCSVRIGPQALPTSLFRRLLGRRLGVEGERVAWLAAAGLARRNGAVPSAAGSGPTGRRRSRSWCPSSVWASLGKPPAPVRSARDRERPGSQRGSGAQDGTQQGQGAGPLSNGSPPLPHFGDWTTGTRARTGTPRWRRPSPRARCRGPIASVGEARTAGVSVIHEDRRQPGVRMRRGRHPHRCPIGRRWRPGAGRSQRVRRRGGPGDRRLATPAAARSSGGIVHHTPSVTSRCWAGPAGARRAPRRVQPAPEGDHLAGHLDRATESRTDPTAGARVR